jgi:Cdc6-like AAA superfamily ATPase
VELLADIKQWLSPQPSKAERIFRVTGIPGSGKSTLSATIVENLRKNHNPVSAQFFISRNIPETIDPDKIIPTIAQQLAIISPTAARVLEMALKDGYPATRKKQVTSLLLDPIRELSKSCDVVVILIDALDELKDADGSVIEILSYIAPTNL